MGQQQRDTHDRSIKHQKHFARPRNNLGCICALYRVIFVGFPRPLEPCAADTSITYAPQVESTQLAALLHEHHDFFIARQHPLAKSWLYVVKIDLSRTITPDIKDGGSTRNEAHITRTTHETDGSHVDRVWRRPRLKPHRGISRQRNLDRRGSPLVFEGLRQDSNHREALSSSRNSRKSQLQLPDHTGTPGLENEQWQVLIALHRTLLHEHHDFFLAAQHPSANPALRYPLASKYAMPAQMWH